MTADRGRGSSDPGRADPAAGRGSRSVGSRSVGSRSQGSRAGGIMAAASGFLGVSSTRRAAVLAVVICALALSVAVPLRNYVTQRQELSAVQEQQQRLTAEVNDLTRRRQQLSDPAEVQAQARSRLGYVLPGETPYVVQLPGDVAPRPHQDASAGRAWYEGLWQAVTGTGS